MWRLFQKAFWDNQCYFWPGFNVHVQPGQCFLQSPLFCETAIIWNLHQVVSIFFQFLFRGLNIKLKVKLIFWTAISSHQVVGMSLTKGWVMENIPRWIWSFSCNQLAENKRKWAGHGLNNVLCCLWNIHSGAPLPRIYSITNTKHWITYTYPIEPWPSCFLCWFHILKCTHYVAFCYFLFWSHFFFSYGCVRMGQMDVIRSIFVRFFFQNCLGSISLITHYRCISWSVPTVCDFLPWFSNSGDTQISVYIHVTSFSKSILGQSVLFLTRLQCTCAAWSVLSAVTTFLWNSYHLKFTSSCVNILSVFI